MDNKGKVSIICAAYNCEKYIIKTIESVLHQEYPFWELIIVNDKSTDRTQQIIYDFSEKDPRIIIKDNKVNLGPAKTRNAGIEFATGKYLTFLDGDDFWEGDFLSTSVNFLNENNYDFCFASYFRVDENLEPLYDPFIVPRKVDYKDLLKTCSISCLTAFLNIESLGKYYMPDIQKRQDYGLWLSILKDVDFAYGIQKPLATYRIRKGSVSRNKLKAIYYVFLLFWKVEKINIIKAAYYTMIYTLNGLKKYR